MTAYKRIPPNLFAQPSNIDSANFSMRLAPSLTNKRTTIKTIIKEITKANKDLSLAQQIKFSNILNAILCVFFMISTILVIIATIGICIGRIKIPLKESAYIHVDSLKKA